MVEWQIGCSGFHYKHWKGDFYPIDLPQKRWFEYYNKHFQTLELNVTFYRFPRLPVLQEWYQNSSPDFVFAAKVFKGITHYRQFVNCGQMLADFYGLLREGLKEKLGCVLFQMPPRMAYKPGKLDQVLEILDPTFNNVLEFRHESWWNAEVYQKLMKQKIIFCGQSHPMLPDEVVVTNKIVYYRFHGVPHLYSSSYNTAQLISLVNDIETSQVKQAFIYFNNDSHGWAIHNAIDLKAIAAKK